MASHFYSMLFRMKNIFRWGLMRNTRRESLSEHSLEVACIAHALAIIRNKRFGGKVDAGAVAAAALYHDATEIITGDMPTPIKYYSEGIRSAYKQIENEACNNLLALLPDDLKEDFRPLMECNDPQIKELVKAADKLAAYIKCIEETNMGNREFEVALKSTREILDKCETPEVKVFIEEFIPGFYMSLDEQKS
ncbi:MAG: 5'-deoxynucleotidase [Clostridia bacterium]|nr:5'-deoxynucleotidase [Clostridia bacterium]